LASTNEPKSVTPEQTWKIDTFHCSETTYNCLRQSGSCKYCDDGSIGMAAQAQRFCFLASIDTTCFLSMALRALISSTLSFVRRSLAHRLDSFRLSQSSESPSDGFSSFAEQSLRMLQIISFMPPLDQSWSYSILLLSKPSCVVQAPQGILNNFLVSASRRTPQFLKCDVLFLKIDSRKRKHMKVRTYCTVASDPGIMGPVIICDIQSCIGNRSRRG
jgi:hypothetical protein